MFLKGSRGEAHPNLAHRTASDSDWLSYHPTSDHFAVSSPSWQQICFGNHTITHVLRAANTSRGGDQVACASGWGRLTCRSHSRLRAWVCSKIPCFSLRRSCVVSPLPWPAGHRLGRSGQPDTKGAQQESEKVLLCWEGGLGCWLASKSSASFSDSSRQRNALPYMPWPLWRGVTHTSLHCNPCSRPLNDMPPSSDTFIRKMLPCSVAETDRKLVRIGTPRASIQKQEVLIGKRKNKSVVTQSWLLSLAQEFHSLQSEGVHRLKQKIFLRGSALYLGALLRGHKSRRQCQQWEGEGACHTLSALGFSQS